MGPVAVVLLGLGAAALFLPKLLKPSFKPIDVSKIPGALPPLGPPSLVKGPKTGTMWLVQEVPVQTPKGLAREKHFDVILNDPNIPAIPHLVLRYAISMNDPTKRFLVTKSAEPLLANRALQDFDVAG